MMRKASGLILAVVVAIVGASLPSISSADSLLDQAPEQDKAIARCATLKDDGELPVKKIQELPKDEEYRVFLIQGHRGKQYVAFILGEGERAACQTLEVGKPVAKARGTFFPGKGGQDVLFIRGKICTKADGCPSMLVFKEKRGEVFAAFRRDGCPEGDKLTTESMFGGQEHSLRISCAARVAPTELEHIDAFMHVIDGKATSLGSFLLGYERVTEEPAGKGKVKQCTIEAPGWARVTVRGSIPMVRVFQPKDALEGDDELGPITEASKAEEDKAVAKADAKDQQMGRQSIWKYDKDLGKFTEWNEKRTTRRFVNFPKCKVVKKP